MVYHHYYGKLRFVYCGSLFILTNTRKEKKMNDSFPSQSWPHTSGRGTRRPHLLPVLPGKKGEKRDLPESQSSHSELEPTGSPLGSAPGSGGAPYREEAWWSGRHPAGGAPESWAACRRADKATLHISQRAEETLLDRKGFLFYFFLILCSHGAHNFTVFLP